MRSITLVLVPVLFAGCLGIPQATANTPRVEAEVQVSVDDSFAVSLEGVGADLVKSITEQVMSQADVGLRFYPVYTDEYSAGQKRPEYLMTVELSDFGLAVAKNVRTIKEGDTQVTEVNRWVSKVGCTAVVRLQKRRENAPPLLVVQESATASVFVSQPTGGDSVGQTMRVKPSAVAAPAGETTNEDTPRAPLDFATKNLTQAIDDAVRSSFRKIIAAVDRELGMHQQKSQPTQQSK